jgi:DNA-binding response OmpR family regulator
MILDLRLPDMSGLEVLKRCRSLRSNQSRMRIMVVSAFGSPEVKEEALRLGADAFADKPVPLETLLQFATGKMAEQLP